MGEAWEESRQCRAVGGMEARPQRGWVGGLGWIPHVASARVSQRGAGPCNKATAPRSPRSRASPPFSSWYSTL